MKNIVGNEKNILKKRGGEKLYDSVDEIILYKRKRSEGSVYGRCNMIYVKFDDVKCEKVREGEDYEKGGDEDDVVRSKRSE